MHGHDVDDDNRERGLTDAAGESKVNWCVQGQLTPAIINVSSWIDIQPQP